MVHGLFLAENYKKSQLPYLRVNFLEIQTNKNIKKNYLKKNISDKPIELVVHALNMYKDFYLIV